MANVFKSKEIYKRIPKVSPNDNPLRAVRGVYIAGAHKAPHYIDSGIHLTDLTSTKAIIKPYDITNNNLPSDNVINIAAVDISPITITDYSKTPINLENETVINISEIVVTPINVLNYIKTNKTDYDTIIHVSAIDVIKPSYTTYLNESTSLNPEPMIVLIDVSSTQATITKGV